MADEPKLAIEKTWPLHHCDAVTDDKMRELVERRRLAGQRYQQAAQSKSKKGLAEAAHKVVAANAALRQAQSIADEGEGK